MKSLVKNEIHSGDTYETISLNANQIKALGLSDSLKVGDVITGTFKMEVQGKQSGKMFKFDSENGKDQTVLKILEGKASNGDEQDESAEEKTSEDQEAGESSEDPKEESEETPEEEAAEKKLETPEAKDETGKFGIKGTKKSKTGVVSYLKKGKPKSDMASRLFGKK